MGTAGHHLEGKCKELQLTCTIKIATSIYRVTALLCNSVPRPPWNYSSQTDLTVQNLCPHCGWAGLWFRHLGADHFMDQFGGNVEL